MHNDREDVIRCKDFYEELVLQSPAVTPACTALHKSATLNKFTTESDVNTAHCASGGPRFKSRMVSQQSCTP